MAKRYGIDLGTTYSCIATVDENGDAKTLRNYEDQNTTPSVVFFESDTNVCVGTVAKENAELEPDKVVSFVKRSMGKDGFAFEYNGAMLSPEEVSAYILKKLANDVQKNYGEEVKDVVITHPAYFGLKEKEATKNAGIIAGLNVLSLIPEPVAAAYAYGCNAEENNGKTILVYDLGGGTFDVTMIQISEEEIRVVCTGGDDNLGGFNWDQALIEHMVNIVAQETGIDADSIYDDPEFVQILQNKAEETKKKISTAESAKVSFSYDGNKIKFEVTRDEFNSITADLCERTIMLTNEMLNRAKEKGVESFDSILLVGGSTYMPQIEEAVTKEFGMTPQRFDPNESVAKGAALYAQKVVVEEGTTDDEFTIGGTTPAGGPKIINVTSKSFGIIATDKNGEDKIYNLVIRDSELPIDVSQKFVTRENNQASVLLQVRESETSEQVIEVSEGIEIGEVSMELPPMPQGSPIMVTFNISDQGLLTVHGLDTTNNTPCETTIDVKGGMTTKELEAAMGRVTGSGITIE